MPLSGLSICAVGDRVVVRDGNSQWQVDSGQYVLGLDVSVEDGVLRVVEQRVRGRESARRRRCAAESMRRTGSTTAWTSKRTATSTRRSRPTSRPSRSTQRTSPPGSTGAGCCTIAATSARRRRSIAARIEQCGPDAVLMFNLGVLLEDLGRTHAALEAYQAAVGEDPSARRLPLQSRAALRIARPAAARDPSSRPVSPPAEQRDALTWRMWVGTSGYAYPEWRGSFYPEKMQTAKMLPYYAERFPTVEINNTFYRMPNAKLLEGWSAQTPEHFKLTLKAPQRITHQKRLQGLRRRRASTSWRSPARSARSSARSCSSCRRTCA